MSSLATDLAIEHHNYKTRLMRGVLCISDFEASIMAPEQEWPPKRITIKPVKWEPSDSEQEKEVKIEQVSNNIRT